MLSTKEKKNKTLKTVK